MPEALERMVAAPSSRPVVARPMNACRPSPAGHRRTALSASSMATAGPRADVDDHGGPGLQGLFSGELEQRRQGITRQCVHAQALTGRQQQFAVPVTVKSRSSSCGCSAGGRLPMTVICQAIAAADLPAHDTAVRDPGHTAPGDRRHHCQPLTTAAMGVLTNASCSVAGW